MKSKKEKRTLEVRVIVQPSMYELLEKKAGQFRTISEVVREIIAEYFENDFKYENIRK